VIILGDSSEQVLAESAKERAGDRVISLAGKTTVEELASILSMCSLLISNDTGTAHIAAAVGTPVLALFLGPASAKDTAPFGNNHIILEANLPCAPCDYKMVCDAPVCKSMIDTDTVFEIANQMMLGSETEIAVTKAMRVSRTTVSQYGEFALVRYERSNSRRDMLLNFYRYFWNVLLTTEDKRADGESEGRFRGVWLTGLSELQGVYDEARDSVYELSSLLAKQHAPQVIQKCIEQQACWQNKLRAMLNDYPDIAPLIRFLLVKSVLARTSNLEYYVQDLRKAMKSFGRGISLMETMRDRMPCVTSRIKERSFA
jgi:hypothetical protein